ncbi:MAG: VCBS domain-containing protein, partial [Synergistaceae bacterium]|nr:VCBS domain-containing protein [Synergistaceae bacterium]
MAKQIVTKAEGEVYRLEADGSKIKLQTGDLVDTGTRIITDTGASVRFEDENGIPMELGENSGAVLFSDVEIEPGNMLFAEESAETAAAGEAAEAEAEQPDVEVENLLPSDSSDDTASEMHSFVKMTRAEYGGDINLSYARDVNVTREIEGRASLNPRIGYDYNVSIIQEVKSYEDPRFPFDGGWHGGEENGFETPRHTAETIPMPETAGTAAVTDEDVPLLIDPLENFVIPSGMQLTVTGASAMYGTVQIIDGKITYQPNADYHGGDKITVTVTDQTGRTYESEVDVTVNSIADTVDDTDSVREHASVDTDVLANDTFADLPGAKVTGVTQGQYGEVTINEDGTVKYTPKTDWLSEGETLTDTYEYTVTTAAGNTETATVTITITGTNDAPVAADNYGSVVEDLRTETDQSHATSDGNILDNDSDPDHGAQLSVKAVGGDESKVGTEIDGKYGKITINEDGTYTYKLNNDNPNVQALRVGEEITDEVFHITVRDRDEHGAVAHDQTLTIKIIGTNDKPEIDCRNENSDSDSANLTDSDAGLTEIGHLTLTDVDIKDTVSTKLESVDIDHDNSTYQGDLPEGLDLNALQGMLNLSNDTIANDSSTGTINWTFNSGGEAFNFLGEGETLVLKYQIKSTDDSGSDNDSDTHTITVTITGTNDAPKISAISGDVTEDWTTTKTGNIMDHVTDADVSDSHTVSHAGDQDMAGNSITLNGTYGEIKINKDGTYEYKLNNDADNVQQLAKGQTVTDTFKVTVTDGHGGTAEQDIKIWLSLLNRNRASGGDS